MNKYLSWERASDREILKKSLQSDLVAITTTDTICGFLANTTEKAFLALNSLKGGRAEKPYLVLIADPKKLEYFVETSDLKPQMLNVIKRCWPGPLTIIFKAKSATPRFLVSKEGTIALRCPDHAGLQQLLSLFDGLFSTSANKSDQPAPVRLCEVAPDLLDAVACVVGEAKSDEKGLPSSIVDFSRIDSSSCAATNDSLYVVREGAYPKEELEKYYEAGKK